MRFHLGMSFRPKSILKYIGLGLIGLIAFIGVHDFAKAETIDYTYINVVNSNNQSSLTCNYNSAGMCPTNISMFPQPPKTEYLVKQLFITFGNNQLVNGHNYNFQLQFHIIRPTSDNNFEQESFLIRSTDNTLYTDNTIYWNAQNYYDSMYGEQATQFNYSGSFTSTKDLPFFVALTFENQEGMYGIFIDSVYLFDNDTGQEIIDSSTQNTIDIMNNQNQNTQNVINNNNSNTQQIIDNQNNLFGNTCSNLLDFTNIFNNSDVVTTFTTNGVNLNSSNAWSNIIYRIPVQNGVTYTFGGDYTSSNNSSVFLSLSYSGSSSSDIVNNRFYNFEPSTAFGRWTTTFTSSQNGYVYLGIWNTKGNTSNNSTFYNMMFSSSSSTYCKYGSTLSKIDTTNQSIEELNHTITDTTLPNIDDSTFGDLEVSSETAISDLVTMPITILRALNNNLGNTCSPYTIPFGLTGGSQTLTFPCIHPEEYLGSTIWNYIDLFICFFMVYNIAMLIISSFESITSLEDTFNSLYEPRHADTGYKPKHGGD